MRNGMSAKCWGEGEGVKGRSRLAGARSAALEALALIPAHCVSRVLVAASVATVSARRLNPSQFFEVQIDDRLKRLRGRRVPQRVRQSVEPRSITGLQVKQFGDGSAPTLDAGPAANAVRAQLAEACFSLWRAR
jgi:hypothetical protein